MRHNTKGHNYLPLRCVCIDPHSKHDPLRDSTRLSMSIFPSPNHLDCQKEALIETYSNRCGVLRSHPGRRCFRWDYRLAWNDPTVRSSACWCRAERLLKVGQVLPVRSMQGDGLHPLGQGDTGDPISPLAHRFLRSKPQLYLQSPGGTWRMRFRSSAVQSRSLQ